MSWTSVFDNLPEKDGNYICCRHGFWTTELVIFRRDDEDPDDNPRFLDEIGHMNGGCTQYHDLSQETIEHRATYGKVTHWMHMPEIPEYANTTELYEKLKDIK